MMTRDDGECSRRWRIAQPPIDLIHDLPHRTHRLTGLPDGTADDQIVSPRMNRAGPVDEFARAVTHPRKRRHDDEAPPANAADARGALRRGENSIEAGRRGIARELDHRVGS